MVFSFAVPLVLASASPRRRELLAEVGLVPEIVPADGLSAADGLDANGGAGVFVEPSPEPGEDPARYVMRCAKAKAEVVARHRPEAVILGADTVVVLPEPGAAVVLGKPASIKEALCMLQQLAGRTHLVITGCALVDPFHKGTASAVECFHQITEVEFMPWPEEILAAYAATGEGLDKAGAYAIQGRGAFLCAGIRGSWSNVVGLPVSLVLQRLYAKKVIRHMSA